MFIIQDFHISTPLQQGKQRPAIVWDCDGVLLDWNTPYREWAYYCPMPMYSDESVVEFNDYVVENDISLSPMRPIDRGDVETLRRLKNKYGLAFFVLTNFGYSEDHLAHRVENLRLWYGDLFDSVLQSYYKNSKFSRFHLLQRFGYNILIHIDDDIKYCLQARDGCGIKDVMFKYHDFNKYQHMKVLKDRNIRDFSVSKLVNLVKQQLHEQ